MTAWDIRPVEPGHIRSAVKLVQSSFSPTLLPYMLYGQSGIERYIEASLPQRGVVPAREAWMALDSKRGQVAGYAEFDVKPGTTEAHLSYLCVGVSYRGRGLGRLLIEGFADAHTYLTELSLNVFEDNVSALSLYRRLGLEEYARSDWTVRPLPPPIEDQLIVDDLPQSLAAHASFGFSRLIVRHGGRGTTLGRLGDTCLRVASARDFSDDGLLAAVRGAFGAARSALLIAPQGEVDVAKREGWATLARSVRMRGPLGADAMS